MNWLYRPDYVIIRWPMYVSRIWLRRRAAIYYVRLHNEYLLTTRDQGFNYGVNSAVKQLRAPHGNLLKVHSPLRFFFARRTRALEQAASTCGITALIMRWRKRLCYGPNLSPTEVNSLRRFSTWRSAANYSVNYTIAYARIQKFITRRSPLRYFSPMSDRAKLCA